MILTAPDILQAKMNASIVFSVKKSLKKQVFSLMAEKVPNFTELCNPCLIKSEPYKLWVRNSFLKYDPKKSIKIFVAIIFFTFKVSSPLCTTPTLD